MRGDHEPMLWADLTSPMQAAFKEAWESFRHGNYGIGAALADSDGRVVATGANMVVNAFGSHRLGGNYMAHAEMNLFAGMSTYDARGFDLHSTLEPCLMCAATALFLNVGSVSYAAADEFFVDLDDLWQHHSYTAPRAVPTSKVVTGPLAAFARLLPMSHTLATLPGSPQADTARAAHPHISDLAADAGYIERLRDCREVGEAIEFALPRLVS